MAFAKFQENRFRIDGEIAENHAILVNLTAIIGSRCVRRHLDPRPTVFFSFSFKFQDLCEFVITVNVRLVYLIYTAIKDNFFLSFFLSPLIS